MAYTYAYIEFAQAYGDGAYNSCTYNCVSGQSTSAGNTDGTGSPSSTGGSLVNTGVAVAGLVTLACLIALIAVLVRVWRRPAEAEKEVVTAENGDPAERLEANAGPADRTDV